MRPTRLTDLNLATRGRKRVPASEAQRGGWSEAEGPKDDTAYAMHFSSGLSQRHQAAFVPHVFVSLAATGSDVTGCLSDFTLAA